MRGLIRVAVAVLMSGALAGGVRGQDTGGRERARATLPPDLFAQVEAVAGEAAGRGLPVEPLYDKALEGAAKRVPPDRIAAAVTLYAGRLGTARQALGPTASIALMVAGADALRRGVSEDGLSRLGSPGDRTPMAVVVMADLVEAGVPLERVLEVLRYAMDRRAGDEALLEIPARLRALMRDGHTPAAAADRLRRLIRDGRIRPGGIQRFDRPGPPAHPGTEPLTQDRPRPKPGG